MYTTIFTSKTIYTIHWNEKRHTTNTISVKIAKKVTICTKKVHTMYGVHCTIFNHYKTGDSQMHGTRLACRA